jgi:hypothetical protein
MRNLRLGVGYMRNLRLIRTALNHNETSLWKCPGMTLRGLFMNGYSTMLE